MPSVIVEYGLDGMLTYVKAFQKMKNTRSIL